MNAGQNWNDDEEDEVLDENQAIKYALALHFEQLAVRNKLGLQKPKWSPIKVKGTPYIDPDKAAEIELPEDYGKWA